MNMDEFKEELWDTVVGLGEPLLTATGLDEKAREELLGKMITMRETKQSTEHESCTKNSTLKEKIENKRFKTKIDDKYEPIIIIKD